MNDAVVDIIQIVYTTLLPICLTYIMTRIKNISDAKDAGKHTDMLVLRLILIDLHDRSVQRGYITRQAYTTFNEVWELYSNKYNGNHLTDKFKKEIEELPIKSENWEKCE